MVLSLCLQWIGLPFREIIFYSNFTDGLHTCSLQIENLHKMEALQPVFQWVCFKLWDSITRFYFIFIFKEDGYRWSGWKELRKAGNDKKNISSVWNCNFMLRGLLLVLGTAFVRSLGAITHHHALEKTKQPREWGWPRNRIPVFSQAAQQWTKARLGPWRVQGRRQENCGTIRNT